MYSELLIVFGMEEWYAVEGQKFLFAAACYVILCCYVCERFESFTNPLPDSVSKKHDNVVW
jgi:hypothetical protein